MKRRSFFLAVFSGLIFAFIAVGTLSAEEYGVREIRGIVYKTVGEEQIQLNLFLPEKDGETLKDLPTLIFLDSGCWYSNGPGDGAIWKMWDCVKEGYAVASVGHRSLATVKFPCQIEDVRAAVRFLRAHAAEYGLNPKRFASAGASSGGHLSTTLGIPDNVCPFDVGDNLDQSGQVNAVIDFYGPTDFISFLDNLDSDNPSCVYQVFGDGSDAEYLKQMSRVRNLAYKCSTVNYVTADFAPTIIFQGVTDTVVPLSQSALFYEALRRAKVPSRMIVANNGIHAIESLGDLNVTKKQIFDFLKEIGF